jgi:hypothetical protein
MYSCPKLLCDAHAAQSLDLRLWLLRSTRAFGLSDVTIERFEGMVG